MSIDLRGTSFAILVDATRPDSYANRYQVARLEAGAVTELYPPCHSSITDAVSALETIHGLMLHGLLRTPETVVGPDDQHMGHEHESFGR